MLWKLQGCNLIVGKKYRSSCYSILYKENVGTKYWFNKDSWSFKHINQSYKNLLKCKLNQVYKTLCKLVLLIHIQILIYFLK